MVPAGGPQHALAEAVVEDPAYALEMLHVAANPNEFYALLEDFEPAALHSWSSVRAASGAPAAKLLSSVLTEAKLDGKSRGAKPEEGLYLMPQQTRLMPKVFVAESLQTSTQLLRQLQLQPRAHLLALFANFGSLGQQPLFGITSSARIFPLSAARSFLGPQSLVCLRYQRQIH